ncbi:hypothetical protein CANINC_003596 [Pichia inconspicua]|uniref:IMP-specific 5'-nucleotidase 1 n=1 Tax=Pichia inconspicua TaxID=52247 RepID=A0A4V4NFF8_9ASCO|nr:hypothetical protein CANINC_003596 [[Candida] inconspicua]
MSSRYRVDYHLKEHRRDEFIQWIKALLATPFVLYAENPKVSLTISCGQEERVNRDAAERYADIFQDLETLVAEHLDMCVAGQPNMSRLSQLVPSIGTFFTPLPLKKAFHIQDKIRGISKRRLVAPSFNDIRIILNTAQAYQLAAPCCNNDTLKLITFDGDITLYDDGKNLELDSKLLHYMIEILKSDIYIGIVTAAGYTAAEKYEERLQGLISAVKQSSDLTDEQKEHLLVMGGEANYLFQYKGENAGLKVQDPDTWILNDMKDWEFSDIEAVLDFGEQNLRDLIEKLDMPAMIIRKPRAVGLIAKSGASLNREQLEECVLRVDHSLRIFPPASKIKWCAFNGGADVWIDIGDKSLGVQILQKFIGNQTGMHIEPKHTLHVGDQFASVGSNDYASRTAATTAWIASPLETEMLLKEIVTYLQPVCNQSL